MAPVSAPPPWKSEASFHPHRIQERKECPRPGVIRESCCRTVLLAQAASLRRMRSHCMLRASYDPPRKPSSPWRNSFFLSDGSDNGDSGSFEMDDAADAKNKGLCYRCTSGSA